MYIHYRTNLIEPSEGLNSEKTRQCGCSFYVLLLEAGCQCRVELLTIARHISIVVHQCLVGMLNSFFVIMDDRFLKFD